MTKDEIHLKEYIDRILEEKDKAISAALLAVKEENKKTEQAAEKRFELLNELRSGVATRDQFDALTKIVDELKTYKAIAESKASSWLVWVGLFFTGASFFFALIATAISLYNTFLTR